MLQGVGITEQQWRVLRVLQENGPLEPTRISEQACLLLPSLTRILQKLDEKKLVERSKDREDRRKQIIKITDLGAELIEANLATSISLMEKTRAQMGDERYEALLDLLNELDSTDTN